MILDLIFFEHGDVQCDIQHGFFKFHFLQGIWETNEGSDISGTFLGAPKSGIRADKTPRHKMMEGILDGRVKQLGSPQQIVNVNGPGKLSKHA